MMKLLRHQSFSFLMISICRDPELPPFLSNPEDSPIEDIDLPVNGPGVLRPSRLMVLMVVMMIMMMMMMERVMEMVRIINLERPWGT